jgi:aryl-alcohol dehydrogenase-like predicted oxidoreductase
LINKSNGFIAIRPFKAKELLNNEPDKIKAIATSLEFVLSRNISSTIVGINNIDQVDEIIQTLRRLDIN